MASKPLPTFDFQAFLEKLKSQFLDLDPRDPSAWPSLSPRKSSVKPSFAILTSRLRWVDVDCYSAPVRYFLG